MLNLRTLSYGLTLILSTTILTSGLEPAHAGKYKLKCKGHYQVVQGNLISTLPCEEAYIAKVARTYGYKVTKKDMQNPNKKQQVCQDLGHDIRINDICHTYNNFNSYGHR